MESDRRLVQRSLAGEQAAFNELYQRHLPRVFTSCGDSLARHGRGGPDPGNVPGRLSRPGVLAGRTTWALAVRDCLPAVCRRPAPGRLETEPLDEESGLFPTAPGLDPLVQCLRQEQLQQIEAALLALPPLAAKCLSW